MYIYPENLTMKATLWLWSLRDIAILGVGLLLSVFAIAQVCTFIPALAMVVYGFLSIRLDGVSVLDFCRYAAAFLLFTPQRYEWGME